MSRAACANTGRQRKLAVLRRALREGTYSIRPDMIAMKMLNRCLLESALMLKP